MHLVIIGNGITGTTVARHVRKLKDWKITMISSESEHFYSRTALMYIYMGHMKYKHTKPYEDWFWKKNKIDLVFDHVDEINTEQKKLFLKKGEPIHYDKLVLATGSKPNKFGWPGQDLDGVQGMYSLQDLELMEKYSDDTERAVIVGGGLIGIEAAEMFHSRNIPVTFLIREKNYWSNVLPEDEAKLVNREVYSNHIDLRRETSLKEILPDENGRVRAIVTDKDEEIACQIVMLTAGVSPNVDLVRDSEIETNRGVLVNHRLETNIEDVYAAGDCAEFTDAAAGDPVIEPLWYTGKMQGQALAKVLAGSDEKYERGIWFNSAKFFDIEYHTYGRVPANLPEDQETFYWEHANGRKCLRINFNKEDRSITGVNSFAMRLRHIVFERWIAEGKSLEYVLENFGEAMFDPEFEGKHHQEILDFYNQHSTGSEKLKIKRKKGLFSLLQFRRTAKA